jgi:hypothetical protein
MRLHLIAIPFLITAVATVTVTKSLPGIQWNDSRGMLPPSLLPVPFRTYMLITPPNCPKNECDGLINMWKELVLAHPHFLWSANCDEKKVFQLCKIAFRNHWLDRNGPQLLQWNRKTSYWSPYVGEKNPSGLTSKVSKEYDIYLTQLSQIHEEGKLKLARSLVLRDKGNMKRAQGKILMLTNQLPVWFNCSVYKLKPGGTSGVGIQMNALAFLAQDFFPPMKIQHQYNGGSNPWYLYWSLPRKERGAFLWTEAKKSKRIKRVSLLTEVDDGSSGGSHRKCLLNWGHSVGVGVERSNMDEKSGEISFVVDKIGGTSSSEVENSSCKKRKNNQTNSLVMELDTGRAYDWFRFRFLEFATIVASRIREKFPSPKKPVVVYDPVCGSCWFPMLVKSAVEGSDSEYSVKPICSDISPDAIAIARRDYEANGMIKNTKNVSMEARYDDNVLFLTGDLFLPLTNAQQSGLFESSNNLRPHVVYYLPPQDKKPDNFDESLKDTMNIPLESVFIPQEADDTHYFFHRLAKELPGLLADQASVFISVAHAQVEDVLLLLDSYNWPPPNILISRTMDDKNTLKYVGKSDHVGTKLFYNPSGLIEYEFDRRGSKS